ncbi:MAG: hypothetical protein L6Q55_07785 [Azonexus sp.]|nr:hypothetical protein [Azonexus sp.]MCK6412310.1 hypothetical protein [Azonexus sp.]
MSPATNSNEPDFCGYLQRQLLGCELPPAQQTSYRRLLTTALHGAPFQFVLCEIFDQTRRDRLIEIIDQAAATAGLSSHRIDCRELPDSAGLEVLEALLNDLAARHTILHLCGFDHWLSRERWQALNIRRDAIAARCRARLLWWLDPDSVRQCALEAPDLWAWRSGVYDFTNTTPPTLPTQASYAPTIDPRSTLERTQRIGQIKAWLQQNPPDELRLPLLDELATLLQDFGQLDEALRIRLNEEMLGYEELGDVHSLLMTEANIAITLIKRGHSQDLPEVRRRLQRALELAEQMQLPKEISTIHQYLDNLPAPRRKKAKKHGRP